MQKIKVMALVIFLCCVGTAHCFALENITNETDTHTILPEITTTPMISVSPVPAQSSHTLDTASSSLVRPKTMDETGNITPEEEKLSTALLQAIDRTSTVPAGNQQVSTTGLIVKTVPVPLYSVTGNAAPARIQSGTLVNVYISTNPGYSTHIVDPLVAEVTTRDEEDHLAAVWADVASLPGLANLEGVRNVREVTRPVVYMGSRLTQGDAIHRTANVRSLLGYTGAGMKIGIISDGVNHINQSKATGDLPDNVHVLRDAIGGDEGTAMLEIVYDMVPDAELYFHDAGENKLEFNQAIAELKAAGCTVICDDIGWIDEPFFEDGIIASNITTLLAGNPVVYVSSAGNDAVSHYQGGFYDDGTGHNDFSRGTSATRKSMYVMLAPNSSVEIYLEWDDQFGHSGNDYNLYFSNANRSPRVYGDLQFSENVQNGTGDPLESIKFKNTGATTINCSIDVFKLHGAAKTLELFIYGGTYIYPNNLVEADSIFGHPAVPDVIAAAAVDQSTPSTIEYFSSRGPVTIAYPSPEIRSKPDISGVDGVNVTGVGGFGSPFYGTSASAPHIAAVVAQIWGAHRDLTPAQVRSALYTSAVDLGTPGWDTSFGYGRADALAMAGRTAPVDHIPDSNGDGPVPPVNNVVIVKTETVNVGGGSAILRATMTGTGLGKNLVITSMPHPDLPGSIAAPPTTVYQYLSITSSTITGVVNQTTLDFTVPQAWLADHGFERGDIVMLHYVNGTWQTLTTEFISQNGGNVFYRATTPSLSYFAIAYQKGGTTNGMATPLPTPVAVGTDSIPETPVPVNSPSHGMIVRKDTQALPSAPVAVPEEGVPLATIIAGVICAVVIIIGAFLVRRWWIRRQNPALFRKYD